MNVDQIYQLQRDDAFARQFAAAEYTTFVAMPFSNRGGYPEARIRKLLETVHEQANKLLKPISPTRKRPQFSKLQRVDATTSGAIVITDEQLTIPVCLLVTGGGESSARLGVIEDALAITAPSSSVTGGYHRDSVSG